MKVKYKKCLENAVVPKQGTTLSGALDLTAAGIDYISSNEVLVHTGLQMQVEEPGYKITVVPRSSFTKFNWVMQNSPGLIDQDYPGEIMIKFRAIPTGVDSPTIYSTTHQLTYEPFPYEVGDRVAQMYLEKVIDVKFEETEELPYVTDREDGFGSTGK